MRGRTGEWERDLCAPRVCARRSRRPAVNRLYGMGTTAVLPGLLCSLPTKFRPVWAECRTKAFALAVDITNSHRSDHPETIP